MTAIEMVLVRWPCLVVNIVWSINLDCSWRETSVRDIRRFSLHNVNENIPRKQIIDEKSFWFTRKLNEKVQGEILISCWVLWNNSISRCFRSWFSLMKRSKRNDFSSRGKIISIYWRTTRKRNENTDFFFFSETNESQKKILFYVLDAICSSDAFER